jgi:hypothetical protein
MDQKATTFRSLFIKHFIKRHRREQEYFGKKSKKFSASRARGPHFRTHNEPPPITTPKN